MFGYDDFYGEDTPVNNSDKGKTFWEVYPIGTNDGIYMARFTDNKWRVARVVYAADIQDTSAHEWNSYKPGVFGVSRKEAQYFTIALWFEHAPVYEYFHEALMGAFKLNIKHPGTQHGINVLAGEYDEPKPSKYVTEKREELKWPGFKKG